MADCAPPSSPRPTRATPRQATSAVAFVAHPPSEDDPLLGFAPYLHKRPRSNSITPDRQRQFVATLAATGIVTQAARSIGKSLEALYKLRARPGAEGFAAAWDEALRHGVARLEDCALERALSSDPSSAGWDASGNGLLCFLLRQRSVFKVDERDLRPGHPVYDRLRAEWEAEAARGADPPPLGEVAAQR